MTQKLNNIIKASKRTYEEASQVIGNTSSWLRNYKRVDFSGKVVDKYVAFIKGRTLQTLDLIEEYEKNI